MLDAAGRAPRRPCCFGPIEALRALGGAASRAWGRRFARLRTPLRAVSTSSSVTCGAAAGGFGGSVVQQSVDAAAEGLVHGLEQRLLVDLQAAAAVVVAVADAPAHADLERQV